MSRIEVDANQIQWKERIATAIVFNENDVPARRDPRENMNGPYNNIGGPAASSGIIIRLETPFARSFGHNLNLTWLVTTWQRSQRSWFCGNYNDGQRNSPFDNLAQPCCNNHDPWTFRTFDIRAVLFHGRREELVLTEGELVA